ncbi:MAG: metalloregulator ArsR/SmtB family transcription factor [Candidatus Desulfatibia sp.]|uniref:ArsR/SmtB family transcription factor n=1 Tax=Candidatus Desulfatibia sp. TaxID=3101189 RepID=UPI002F2DFC0C
MLHIMTITKALADENRVRALFALKDRELCVCQIIELLGLAASTVSKHMSILTQAGLVESRKDGRWRYYHLADDDAPPEVRAAIAWICSSLSDNSKIRQDSERLKKILRLDPEELCRQQSTLNAVKTNE